MAESLAGIIAHTAESTPDRVAVRSGEVELTYAEIEDRTARLATTLQANGVGRGDRVGLYLHKSVESYVALHGILRAGAAYVPIDPVAPTAMIDSIVTDCGIEVVISAENKRRPLGELKQPLRVIVGAKTVPGGVVSISWDDVAQAERFDGDEPDPSDIAYIMYTSGSTGTPKGIVHTHASGLAWTERIVEVFGLHGGDRLANIAPLHFDISLLDVLAAPAAEATSLLIPEPYLKMPASLSQLLQDEAVTNWYSAPTAAWQLLHRGALDERDLSCLKRVILGGESLPPTQIAALMAHTPNAVYSNFFGPAETNGTHVYHFGQPPPLDEIVPIGAPIDGVECAIVAEDGTRVTPGESGELLVSGVTTMSHYWNRPDLTDAAFALSPADAEPGTRWYRTGDLVVDDGEMRFLGRRDHQVKIRGHRLELEGVEQALADVDGVELAVVGLVPEDGGTSTLGAAITTTVAVDVEDLRSAVAAKLPNYAVPDTIVIVEDMPSTPSGKVDRRSVRLALAKAPNNPIQET